MEVNPRSANAPVEGTFRYGPHQLAYEIYGDSGTPCLLMHGLLLDSLINRDLAERFVEQGYRVVLLDLLGHGKSDKPTDPRELRIDFFADHALALLDHLAIDRALIGGVSLGAITALQLAAQEPDRCLGLFIEMPVMEWSTTFAAILLVPVIGLADFAAPVIRPITRLLGRLPRPKTAYLASLLNAASADPAVTTAILHGILVGPVVPPSMLRRRLMMPSLVIGHGGDRLHELRDSIALASEMPNSRLLKARWVGELRVTPERLMRDIREFLVSVRLAAATDAPVPSNSELH